MIKNATLLRIDAPPAPIAGGDLAPYTPGAAISVRCCLDTPSFVIQRLIDQLKLDSTAVLYVDFAGLPNGPQVLLPNSQVLVRLDGSAVQTLQIDYSRPMVNGAVSHTQCFLRAA